jgi:hypothetical protein
MVDDRLNANPRVDEAHHRVSPPGSPGLDHARRNCRCAQTREGLAG